MNDFDLTKFIYIPKSQLPKPGHRYSNAYAYVVAPDEIDAETYVRRDVVVEMMTQAADEQKKKMLAQYEKLLATLKSEN